jgi:ferredoxin-NADP reductase
MPVQKTKLIKKEEVAVGTMAFYFEKPQGFDYRGGQTIDLTLAPGMTYTFSLASAPHEEHLIIATRMRDTAFKQTIGAMDLNSDAHVDGPFGSFTLHNNVTKPAIFLAGGIGITPFFSMIKQAISEKLPHNLWLLYSNRRPEDAPFLKELTHLEEQHPSLRLMATMTGIEKSTQRWICKTGHISQDMIKEIPDYPHAIFYLAGPPIMVAGMFKLLKDMNIDTDNIKTDEFAGY